MQPKVYVGSGSAIDNYRNPDPKQTIAPGSTEWGKFDKANSKHLAILSLCRQAQWTQKHFRLGEVADLARLGNWLQTMAPVRKPLLEQSKEELSKTIKALEGVVISIFK